MKLASRELNRAWQSFSVKQRLVLYVCLIISVIAVIGFWLQVNNQFLVEVPAKGGSLYEGVVGAPRFINPLLAVTDADRDMVAIVYSGLTRASSSVSFTPDLAEKFEVSSDNLTYTFTLRPNLKWHDGEPVTADDVVFTVERAKDPLIKSPKRAAWEGVKVEAVDKQTVRFTLKQPYGGFLENTTMGILPAHLWKPIAIEAFSYDELNLSPIGSGPYEIKKVAKKDKENIITYIDLTAFKNFALGEPNINRLRLRFYENDDALISGYKRGDVQSLSAIAPELAKPLIDNDTQIVTAPLPRVFGIFFNPNHNKLFTASEVREALNQSLDKKSLIDGILFGFGLPINGPIPPGALGYTEQAIPQASIDQAKTTLENRGWKLGSDGIYEKTTKTETTRLSFTLATSDAQELKATAEYAQAIWKKLGAEVSIKVFEKGDLGQDVIRPREYDAVLFGEVMGRTPDPYTFWHSSQRFDPGLNIAMYANVATDKVLENIRTTANIDERLALYKKANDLIVADHPAVFLYAPSFIYVVPKEINNINLLPISIPAGRFTNIADWYIATDKVWNIFAN